MDLQTIAPLRPEMLDLQALERQMCQRGCGNKAFATGLCRTCYAYQRRTGRPRPEALIVQHGQRMISRRMLAQSLRF